jgi:hypothetical protein
MFPEQSIAVPVSQGIPSNEEEPSITSVFTKAEFDKRGNIFQTYANIPKFGLLLI